MLKPRTVYDFDTDILKVGALITFCQVEKILEDESGNYEWMEGKHINALVMYADSEFITVMNANGRSYELRPDELVNCPSLDESYTDHYRILGVVPNAIKE